MSVEGSRIIILGASGHIGGALRSCLAREPGVEVIGHSSKTLDLTRPEAFAVLDEFVAPESIIVFGSALTPDKGQNFDTLMANLSMVSNVGRYIEARPVGRWVYVSSDAVYGFDFNPVTDPLGLGDAKVLILGNDSVRVQSKDLLPAKQGQISAALAKYAGERMMEYVTRAKNLPLLSLRVAGVYGPGDPHSAYGPNAFARSLVRDRAIRLFGNGEEERDHVYVDDVARLTVELIRSGAAGVFNVATGECRSFAEIVATIRGLVPYEFAVASIPRKGPITHRRYDITKLQRVVPGFGFTPFKEGLKATLEAFGAL